MVFHLLGRSVVAVDWSCFDEVGGGGWPGSSCSHSARSLPLRRSPFALAAVRPPPPLAAVLQVIFPFSLRLFSSPVLLRFCLSCSWVGGAAEDLSSELTGEASEMAQIVL